MLPIDLDLLMPPAYAAWRPLVADALAFFVGRLSPDRRRELLSVQFSFGDDDMADRLTALLRHCPTLHKLGQVLARDPRLDPALRARLVTLESQPPSMTLAEVRERAARSVDMDDMRLEEAPLAEGSVAIVVPFERLSGSCGVLKLLKPGIEARMYEELAIWSSLVDWLEGRCARCGLDGLNVREVLEEVRDLLLSEVRLDVEQANMRAAHGMYRDDRDVIIPEVLAGSTRQVTAMTRVEGVKVTESRTVSAAQVVRALIARPFSSTDERTMVHADPHAGNLFATADGRLAILDWSLVTWLDRADRAALVGALLAGLTLDGAALRGALEALARGVPSGAGLDRVVDEGLRAMREGRQSLFDWLLGILDAAVLRGGMTLRGNLMLFRKTLLTVSHVTHALEPTASVGDILTAETVGRLVGELPWRLCAPLDARFPQTHLSTLDLYRVIASWPLTAARYWLGAWQDAGRRRC